MSNAIIWGILALLAWFTGLPGRDIVTAFCCLFSGLYLAFELFDKAGLFLADAARARAITPLTEFARLIAPFNKEQLEALRRAGQFDIRAQLGVAGVKLSLYCPDGHLIPFYDEQGNDLQSLLRDLANRANYPYLRVTVYSNNSIMQNHLRSFIAAGIYAGYIEASFGNVAAKWAPDKSPQKVAQELDIKIFEEA